MSITTVTTSTTTTTVTTETFERADPDVCLCEEGYSTKTPEYSYEVINLDTQSFCFVEPDGPVTSPFACTVSDFKDDTGVDLATLQRYALSGELMKIDGHPGWWTVGNCISNYP
tara:strand:- start:305 stop:646 length:342 start_codon:yes stop_codon:yes gene_type:complete